MTAAHPLSPRELRLSAFIADPTCVREWTEDEALGVIQTCDDHYYNTCAPLLTDSQYDLLCELVEARGFAIPARIGAKPTGETVKLPLHCGSADKIKAKSKELERFLKRFVPAVPASAQAFTDFVLSDKLDGMSATYWRDRHGHHLTSRGDGTEGTVWDHLLPYLKLPALAVGEVVRGEVIMSFDDFAAMPEINGEPKKSARHSTAGLVNKFEQDPNWARLQFIAFGAPSHDKLPSEQLAELERRGFPVVWHEVVEVEASGVTDLMTDLEAIYAERRRDGEFQIDGLIVTADVEHELVTSGNPEHMAAFKMPLPEQMAETVVEYIEWNLSRYNYWIPRVKVSPVKIGGATYNWCHGENARAIVSEGIGPGTRVILLRSGDVIPDIYEVAQKAEPQLPDGPHEWGESGVDLILPKGQTSRDGDIKQLSHILTAMGMAGLKIGTVKKLYDEGYTTLASLLKLDVRALTDVRGIKERSAESIVKQLSSAQTTGVPLYKLMAASAMFGRGFGETKARSALAAAPELLNLQPLSCDATIVQLLEGAEDFSLATAERFVQDWPEFLAFMADIPMVKVLAESEATGPLSGEVIVFTEFRDADLQDLIEQAGGQVGGSVTKKTTRVVTVNPEGTTTKLKKARDMSLPIQFPQDFAAEFGLGWG